jgi:photosystem I P700 chlorophyll a apoprotein A2
LARNFETWVTNPLKVKPIAHAIWDPHWSIKAFSKGTYPVNMHTLVYTIGGTRSDLELIKNYTYSIGLLLSSALLFAGWLHLQQNSVQAYLGLKQ